MNVESVFQMDFCEGILKQQCLDATGMYVWEKKHFALDIVNQNMHVKLSDDSDPAPQAAISLRGAKYAKEWSFSSSLAGFGFDLVWSSGKIWSFLVDDEGTCKSWVDAINRSVSSTRTVESANLKTSDQNEADSKRVKPPLPPPTQHYATAPVTTAPMINYDESVAAGTTTTRIQASTVNNSNVSGASYDDLDRSSASFVSAMGITVPSATGASAEGPKGFPGIPLASGGSGSVGGESLNETKLVMQSPMSHQANNPSVNNVMSAEYNPSAAAAAGIMNEPSTAEKYGPGGAGRINALSSGGSYHHQQQQQQQPSYISGAGTITTATTNNANMDVLSKPSTLASRGTAAAAAASSEYSKFGNENRLYHDYAFGSKVPAFGDNNSATIATISSTTGMGGRGGGGGGGATVGTGTGVGGGGGGGDDDDADSVHVGGSGNSSDDSFFNSDYASQAWSLPQPESIITNSHHHHHQHHQQHHHQQHSSTTGTGNGTGTHRLPVKGQSDRSTSSGAGVASLSTAGGTTAIQHRLLFGKPTANNTAADLPEHVYAAGTGTANAAGVQDPSEEGAGGKGGGGGGGGVSPQDMQQNFRNSSSALASMMPPPLPSSTIFTHEIESLQARCQQLKEFLNKKQSELETSKLRNAELQDKFDETTSEFEQRLDLARDRERQLITESKREMENKLLRMSNDNMSFYEAATKSLKVQHERELSCLREELAEERKRHSSLLDRAQTLRERAERSESEAQSELSELKDKHSALQIEYTRSRRELDIERSGWDRERQRLLSESESTIASLQEDKEKLVLQSHQELKAKVAEMNEKMQQSLSSIKENDVEILKQELEGQRLRSLAELQKECQKEVEIVRTEERRLATAEMENIRSAFLAREHQTSEDLIQLEKLHAVRVSQLEQQVHALKAQNSTATEKLERASRVASVGSEEQQRSAVELKKRLDEHAARADALHRELNHAHAELQESKARETSYREQLGRALTQSRLQHAELLEAKQQAASGSAQAFQWRNASQESALSIAAAETSAQIARDEVSMLEHALRRVEQENADLKDELQRADRMIYGAHQKPVPASNARIRYPSERLNTTDNNNTNNNNNNKNMANLFQAPSAVPTRGGVSTKYVNRSVLDGQQKHNDSNGSTYIYPELLVPTASSSAKRAAAATTHSSNSYAIPTASSSAAKKGATNTSSSSRGRRALATKR